MYLQHNKPWNGHGKNLKNFKETGNTYEEYRFGKDVNGLNIRVSSAYNIFINDKRTYWDQTRLDDYMYQKVSQEKFFINETPLIYESRRIK